MVMRNSYVHFDASKDDIGLIFKNISGRFLRELEVRSDVKTKGDKRVYSAYILGVFSLPKTYSYSLHGAESS